MSHKDVYAALKATGIPAVHMAWPEGSAPPLPWCVYLLDERNDVYADNGNYVVVPSWTVELYEKARDAEVEGKIESALSSAFGSFTKQELWVESENCLEVVYGFTEIEGD